MSFRFVAALSLSLFASVGCQTPHLPGFGFLSRLTGRAVASDVEPERKDARQGTARVSSLRDGETPTNDGGRVQLAEFTQGSAADIVPQELTGATVVAEVDGTPIFADDVLEPYKGQLAQALQQLTPEQLSKLRAKLIRQDLKQHIEKAVLIAALYEGLTEEQHQKMDAQVDQLFNNNEVPRLQKLFKVGTRVELERALDAQGTTLANQKSAFAAREMAMLYIGQKASANVRFSRQDLLKFYEDNKQQYYTKPKVRWQQILISKTRPGGKQESVTVLRDAITGLKNNEDFGDVAKKYSDGPKSENGGEWDWTGQNSLADKRIDRALFEIPEGEISEPLESDSSITLVKVIERNDGGYTPFEDVQDAINRKLQAEARTKAASDVIENLIQQAAIRTIFDDSF
jgi:parvulin-like peptidyl-prolyl isomerase